MGISKYLLISKKRIHTNVTCKYKYIQKETSTDINETKKRRVNIFFFHNLLLILITINNNERGNKRTNESIYIFFLPLFFHFITLKIFFLFFLSD